MARTPAHISVIAKTIMETEVSRTIQVGEINLPLNRIENAAADHNSNHFLNGLHDYVIQLGGKPVEISVQLFLNPLGHYRLFTFTKTGMLFSVNFTTAEDAKGMISLTQKIKFAEGRTIGKEAARGIRQAKARLLADVLVRSGITVTDNLEIVFGSYCSKRKVFLDTTPSRFLSNFIAVSMLKGHFQGNKGFQFSCLPRFDDSFPWKWKTAEKVRASLVPNKQGARGERSIPLGLRFNVLDRDGGKCRACGRSPEDGVQMHVDHIKPYSLGGLTVLDNLQTLCGPCNLGKSNRSETRFL